MKRPLFLAVAASACLCLCAAPVWADPANQLLSRIPAQANVVLTMDVQAVQKSPLAQKEKWAERHGQSSLCDFMATSPLVSRLVVASQLDPATLDNVWEVAVVALERPVYQKEIVQLVTGSPEEVGGQPAVLSPRNSYIVSFAPQEVGVMRPANRQATARWIRSTRSTDRVALSPYLQEALQGAPKDAQAVLAFELADIADTEGLRQRLKSCKALAAKSVPIEPIVKVLSGVRGMTLSLRVDDKINGQLRMDFDDQVGILGPAAKPLLLEGLNGMGASMDDLENWSVGLDGKAITMQGTLSERGVRQFLSPLMRLAPTAVVEEPAPSQGGGQTVKDPKALASRRYFVSVQTLLTDLKEQKTKKLTQLAYWHKTAADQMDNLPLLNVDPELLEYGAQVSTTLRGISNMANNAYLTQKGVAGNAGEQWVQVPNAYNYYGGGPGWGFNYSLPANVLVNNYGAANDLIARAGKTETAVRQQTWTNIDEATIKIRQKMTQKYQIEFR
jgi:hypothetical protein